MEYIETVDFKDIIRLTDLKRVRNFILDMDGFEPDEICSLTYGERLTAGNREILKRLNRVYKDDENELDNAICDYSTATMTYKEIFTEIGMITGARLLFQLLCCDDE